MNKMVNSAAYRQYTDAASKQKPDIKRYVFLLLDSFSTLGFNCAIEALNATRGYKDGAYYDWLVLSEDGQPVHASNGVSVNVDGALQPLNRKDTIVVCGGDNIAATSTLNVLNWLRRETRKGVSCGGIESAAYTLAMAGLLIGKNATTHWEYHTAFAEVFPEINLQNTIYSGDNKCFTCAGGAAAIDLMLHLIAQDYNVELASWVADKMIYTSPRTMTHSQRLSLNCHLGIRNVNFSQALALMSANTEYPIPPNIVAQKVNISTRQLERWFKKYLNTSPKVYYMGLRLEKARSLLIQTDMPITEISLASGFNSTSHFSKCYRRKFGVSPSFQNVSSCSGNTIHP